jgi:hypothetical protein
VSANPGDSVGPADEQQARLVSRLRAAGGEPVSFDELRSEGIENPAVLCYELEVAGLRIARVHRRDASGRAPLVGVRLEEPEGAGSPPQPAAPGPGEAGARMVMPSPASRPRHPRAGPWTLGAAIALVVAAATVATLALTRHPNGPAAAHPRTHTRGVSSLAGRQTARLPSAASSRGANEARSAGGTPTPSGQNRARIPISPAAAARLQAEGHQLLGQGRYADAATNQRAALAASGGSLARCMEPATEACLTYAYALYDLGRALRLEGNPTAAVPILSERLRIDNQRPTVQYELDLARRQLRTAPSAPSPRSPGNG